MRARQDGNVKSGAYILCVFCGSPTARSSKVWPVPNHGLTYFYWVVSCYACNGCGPRKATEKEALRPWIKITSKIRLVYNDSKVIQLNEIEEVVEALAVEGSTGDSD